MNYNNQFESLKISVGKYEKSECTSAFFISILEHCYKMTNPSILPNIVFSIMWSFCISAYALFDCVSDSDHLKLILASNCGISTLQHYQILLPLTQLSWISLYSVNSFPLITTLLKLYFKVSHFLGHLFTPFLLISLNFQVDLILTSSSPLKCTSGSPSSVQCHFILHFVPLFSLLCLVMVFHLHGSSCFLSTWENVTECQCIAMPLWTVCTVNQG